MYCLHDFPQLFQSLFILVVQMSANGQMEGSGYLPSRTSKQNLEKHWDQNSWLERPDPVFCYLYDFGPNYLNFSELNLLHV